MTTNPRSTVRALFDGVQPNSPRVDLAEHASFTLGLKTPQAWVGPPSLLIDHGNGAVGPFPPRHLVDQPVQRRTVIEPTRIEGAARGVEPRDVAARSARPSRDRSPSVSLEWLLGQTKPRGLVIDASPSSAPSAYGARCDARADPPWQTLSS